MMNEISKTRFHLILLRQNKLTISVSQLRCNGLLIRVLNYQVKVLDFRPLGGSIIDSDVHSSDIDKTSDYPRICNKNKVTSRRSFASVS